MSAPIRCHELQRREAVPFEWTPVPHQSLQDCWLQLFWDLSLCPSWQVETALPGIRLTQRLDLERLHLLGEVILVQGAGHPRLYAWTTAWHGLVWHTGVPKSPCLEIQGIAGERLLSLQPFPDVSPFIQELLACACAYEWAPRGKSAGARPLSETSLLLTHWHGLADGWLDPADLAEAYGWLRSPARHLMGSKGQARLADPDLIPCFLESLVYQSVQIRLLTGSAGALQFSECSLHTYHRLVDGWVTLIGEGVELRLEPRQIDGAWIIEEPDASPQLRLYDATGRLLLLMAEATSDRHMGTGIWSQLLRALLAD